MFLMYLIFEKNVKMWNMIELLFSALTLHNLTICHLIQLVHESLKDTIASSFFLEWNGLLTMMRART